MAEQKDKVVLAYSGGLDTSVCIKWLQDEKDLDVIARGGRRGTGARRPRARPPEGARTRRHRLPWWSDMRDDVRRRVPAPRPSPPTPCTRTSTRCFRPCRARLISKHLVDVAHEYGAKYMAHGCTGKGNDQVRFEASITMLDPDARDHRARARMGPEDPPAGDRLGARPRHPGARHARPRPYSIDDNLWGRAIECGVLEDPWTEPPDGHLHHDRRPPSTRPTSPSTWKSRLRGAACPCVARRQAHERAWASSYALNEIAGRNGYGRIDMIENRLVGVKSRECYEAPGAPGAHHAPTRPSRTCASSATCCTTSWASSTSWADAASTTACGSSPLKEALDAFLASTQQLPLRHRAPAASTRAAAPWWAARAPTRSTITRLATYDADDQFDHKAAAGFIKLQTLSTEDAGPPTAARRARRPTCSTPRSRKAP